MRGVRQDISVPECDGRAGEGADAVRCDDFVFLSSVGPLDEDGRLVSEGDVAAQYHQACENIERVLRTTRLELTNAASLTVYLRDINDCNKIEPVKRAFFGSVRPAHTVCGVAALAVPGALIEVQAVACKPGSAKLIP